MGPGGEPNEPAQGAGGCHGCAGDPWSGCGLGFRVLGCRKFGALGFRV